MQKIQTPSHHGRVCSLLCSSKGMHARLVHVAVALSRASRVICSWENWSYRGNEIVFHVRFFNRK